MAHHDRHSSVGPSTNGEQADLEMYVAPFENCITISK
jgi:hypothetical protein